MDASYTAVTDTGVPRFRGALQVRERWGCDVAGLRGPLAGGKGCFGPKLRWTSGAMEKDHTCLSGIPISAWLRLSTRGSALPCPQSLCFQGHLNQFSPLTGLLSAPFRNPALPFLLGLRFWITYLVCEDLQFYSPILHLHFISFSSFGLSIQGGHGLCSPLTLAAPSTVKCT